MPKSSEQVVAAWGGERTGSSLLRIKTLKGSGTSRLNVQLAVACFGFSIRIWLYSYINGS